MRGTITATDPDASRGDPPKTFTFDTVFPADCKQVDVYNEVARPIVECVLEGYNGKWPGPLWSMYWRDIMVSGQAHCGACTGGI